VFGDLTREITQTATQEDCSAIVVGARARAMLGEIVSSSTLLVSTAAEEA
jgi:hypothetical protein